MYSSLKKHKYAFCVAVIILFHGINNYLWLKQDNESMGTDVAIHINSAVSLRQGLGEIAFSRVSLAQKGKQFAGLFFSGQSYWPKFVPFFAALASYLPPDPLFWIRFSNMFYFAILIISVYLLGKKAHSPQAGVLAAVFISLYPGIFGLSRKFGLDFPLIGITALAMYLLFSSDNFQNRRYSILFGITSGLGMLIKGQLLLFLIGPFLYTAGNGFMNRESRKKSLVNISVMLGIALAIALSWWYRMHSGLWGVYLRYNIPVALQYFLVTAYHQMSPLFFTAFLMGIAFYLVRRKLPPLFLLLWLVTPCLLLLAFYTSNHERYIFPAFAALALISVTGILEMPSRKARLALFLFFIFFGLVNFFNSSYTAEFSSSSWITHRPQQHNHRKVMDIFSREVKRHGAVNSNIGMIEEDYFRGDPCIRLGYFLKLINPQSKVFLSADGYIILYPYEAGFRASEGFLANLNNFDFLLVFSQNPLKPSFWNAQKPSGNAERDVLLEAQKAFRDFKIIKRGVLRPEEIYVFLLKRQ
ncbi:MAG: glycosyltransferase family 39 protein [Candidatus Omnitrophota bacterium]